MHKLSLDLIKYSYNMTRKIHLYYRNEHIKDWIYINIKENLLLIKKPSEKYIDIIDIIHQMNNINYSKFHKNEKKCIKIYFLITLCPLIYESHSYSII